MKKGEEAEVVIQPRYAFGAEGNAAKNVPANSEVTYFVTLTTFVKVSVCLSITTVTNFVFNKGEVVVRI